MSSISFEEDMETTKTYGERIKKLHLLVDSKELHWWGRNDLATFQKKDDEKLEKELKMVFKSKKYTEDERSAFTKELMEKIKSCKV